MTITTFTRPVCAELAKQFLAHCESFAKQHGLTVKRDGGGKFEASYFRMGVEFQTQSADGKPAGKDAEAFKMLAGLWGLSPDDLGRTIIFRSKPHKIIGARTRGLLPILIQSDAGQSYYIGEDTVKRLLDAAKVAS